MNVSGCNQLGKNFLAKMKKFWEGKEYSDTADHNGREHPSVFEVISAPSSKNSDNQESGDFNSKECLKDTRQNNLNRPVLGQVNINSIRNKFSCISGW